MSDSPSNRSRVVTWENPLAGAGRARTMSGIDYLRAIASGEIPPPPIARLMDFGMGEVAVGKATFTVKPQEFHYNPIGSVHGGLPATLFDSALGCAIHSALPAGSGYTTLELKVNFVRPITAETGTLFCKAEILHLGGRIATAEAKLVDEKGQLYGHATTTCMLFRGPKEG